MKRNYPDIEIKLKFMYSLLMVDLSSGKIPINEDFTHRVFRQFSKYIDWRKAVNERARRLK